VFTFPQACTFAEITIDPETGAVTLERYLAVDDYGASSTRLTKGQVQGRVAQASPGAAGAYGLRTAIGPAAERFAARLRLAAGRRSTDLDITSMDCRPAQPAWRQRLGQAGCIAAPQSIVCAILDRSRRSA